jgi:putative hydrolase of the HAD superfamily
LKNAPRLYIFDMGDVVCGNVHCVPAMAADLGLSVTEFFAAAGAVSADGESPYNAGDVRSIQEGTLTADAFWNRFEERAGRLFPDRGVRLARREDGRPVDLWGRHFRPERDEAVAALIAELAAAAFRVVCGTNTLGAHYEIHRARGDYGCFRAVYASHLIGKAKPAAAFWNHILAQEAVSAADAFFVDDAPANVAAAAQLGLAVHHFQGAAGLREELSLIGALST